MENTNLKLAHSKPLAFIKIQTTGLNPTTDRIIELSITKIDVDGKRTPGSRLINPEMEIPAETTKINGITNEMVKSKPNFKAIAEGINSFLSGCDFIGFNIDRFDLRFLSEEFNRAGVEFTLLGRKVVDIASIYHTMEPRDLTAAYSFYCEKKNEGLINSQQTTDMYVEIINSMMDKYRGVTVTSKDGSTTKVEATVEAVHDTFNKNKKQLDIEGKIVLNEAGRPMFTFGKFGPKDGKPGQIVADSLLKDEPYYDWLVNVSDLPSDTKLVIKKIFAKAKAVTVITK